MAMTPVKKTSVSEQVFDQLKKEILTGAWKTGSKIPSENELAETLGVSRVTVRQALQKLTVLGLLDTRVGEGSFVQQADAGNFMKLAITPSMYLQPHTLKEVFVFRRAIEIQTAGLAARYAGTEQIAALRRAHEQQLHIDAGTTMEAFAQDDLIFHMGIARCTGNSLILTVYEALWDVLSNAMRQTVAELGFQYAIKYHGILVDAIEAHDERRAENIMREHLEANEAAIFGKL